MNSKLRKTIFPVLLAFVLFAATLGPADIPAEGPLSSQATGQEQWTVSAEQKLWGLMTIWAEAKFNYPYFDRIPDIDWDKKAREYIPRVLSADSLAGYYEVLMEFAALLKDGHTWVVPPWMFVKPGYDHPPLELQVVEDKFVVARTGDTEEIRGQRIFPGVEVLEVGDHVPVRTYLQENVQRFRSYGTSQADEAIGLVGIFSGPKGSQVPLKVKNPDGTVRDVSLTRNSKDKDGTVFQWRWVRWFMIDPLIETRMIQPDIGYIRISNFSSAKVVEEFQKVFDLLDLSGIQGLILDVRYNSGGNSAHAYKIVSFLTDQPLKASKWKSLSYVPAYRSWGQPTSWIEGGPSIIEPRNRKRYAGPVVVLTGPGTFSAAEDFLVPLQYSGRAVLVGEKTAGSTGNPISVPLPGNGTFRVVSKRDMFPDGREFVGIGISPDIEVHPTQQDLLQGKDPVLQKGVEIIRNWDTRNTIGGGR
jgi:carboxyl-terminal processing protease